MAPIPKPSEEQNRFLDFIEEQNRTLVCIMQDSHRVIEANTSTNSRLTATLEQMQSTLTLLVSQVTTNITQQSSGVPLRIFLIVVLLLAALVAAAFGLNVSGYEFMHTS